MLDRPNKGEGVPFAPRRQKTGRAGFRPFFSYFAHPGPPLPKWAPHHAPDGWDFEKYKGAFGRPRWDGNLFARKALVKQITAGHFCPEGTKDVASRFRGRSRRGRHLFWDQGKRRRCSPARWRFYAAYLSFVDYNMGELIRFLGQRRKEMEIRSRKNAHLPFSDPKGAQRPIRRCRKGGSRTARFTEESLLKWSHRHRERRNLKPLAQTGAIRTTYRNYEGGWAPLRPHHALSAVGKSARIGPVARQLPI